MSDYPTIPQHATLFWHRRDLRIRDNTALHRASEHPPVVPIYCVESDLLAMAGEKRTAFFVRALADLQARYRMRGSDVLVIPGPAAQRVPELATQVAADRVYWNADHSAYATERDETVESSLAATDVAGHGSADLALHEPGSILTGQGEHYSVFSYYFRKWADREAMSPIDPIEDGRLAAFDAADVAEVLPDPPVEAPIGWTREDAVHRLESFVEDGIFDYQSTRDVPATAGTSRLSQDLKFGLLGIREVFEATERAAASTDDESERENVTAFQRQLAWRDFYRQVLAANPDMAETALQPFDDPIEWRTDPEGLRAWKHGKTGFPIVDAGMRQLRSEGWMHNRVRMIVASFLTKDLLIDWRAGYRWFRRHLVDHETANNAGGWQWASSTGADAQPYFRIFNPMTQGERHDPDGTYVRTYVPELEGVDSSIIHHWNELAAGERKRHAPAYPAPIVDHATRREEAIARFEHARGN